MEVFFKDGESPTIVDFVLITTHLNQTMEEVAKAIVLINDSYEASLIGQDSIDNESTKKEVLLEYKKFLILSNGFFNSIEKANELIDEISLLHQERMKRRNQNIQGHLKTLVESITKTVDILQTNNKK